MRATTATFLAIAISAAAAPAAAQRYGGDYASGGEIVRCESNDGRTRECATDGSRALLVRQLSRSPCIEGRTWGSGRQGLWVAQGCRADFQLTGYGLNGYGGGSQVVRCDSDDGRYNRCELPGRGAARLIRQSSRSACIEGRSWGSDRRSVWVAEGCRGEFTRVRGGWNRWEDSAYGGRVFRCESSDGRYAECAANTRAGVQLVRQLSRSPCIEGRTWGYGRGGIWVAQGCRAEFRAY